MDIEKYNQIRSGRAGFYEQKRGLFEVRGKEAVQFLDGMVTNDMKTLADGAQMLAAFPNAQGRLLALIQIRRQGDRFLIETEEATREKLFQNLFRFTFAGDFLIVDLSEKYLYFEIFGPKHDVYHPTVGERFADSYVFELSHGAGYFIPNELADRFRGFIVDENACVIIDHELYELLRIESGVPRFGTDMDESTIIPELGLEGLISYTKGCYVGQEIIARIHFRGHVAKRLTGLIFDGGSEAESPAVARVPSISELTSLDGKNAGRITSTTFSPKLDRIIGLAYVRYDHLAAGTQLTANGEPVTVQDLPLLN